MYLYTDLVNRAKNENPVRVALVGAGKFGSMFLSQVPTTPGLIVSAIADLNPDGARASCLEVGWSGDRVDQVVITDDANVAISREDVDVVVEATGNPAARIRHARVAFHHGKHVVMVNVEADVLAGPLLAREARSANVVLLHGLRRPAGAVLRTRRLGAVLRFQSRRGRKGDQVSAGLSQVDARYGLGPLWSDRRKSSCGRHEQQDV